MEAEGLLKKRFGDNFKSHKSIREYCPLKVGGTVKFLVEAYSTDDIIDAVSIAKQKELECEIIGLGTHILLSEYGFPGLIVINRCSNIAFLPGQSKVIVDAGVNMKALVMKSANRNLSGLEKFYSYEGTLGGNILRHFSDLSPALLKVSVISERNEILTYSGANIEKMIYKIKSSKKYIILTALIQLRANKQERILDSIHKVDSPSYSKDRVSGKIFVSTNDGDVDSLLKSSKVSILREGDALVYSNDFNRLMNRKNATSQDAKSLIDKMKRKVMEQSGKEVDDSFSYLGLW